MPTSNRTESAPLRIAMWCGPRNISTALLRAWENRPDTFVVDEPLYAYYLQASGAEHPLRDEIIARYDPDWQSVTHWLTTATQPGKTVFYQKQMSHHLLPEVGRDWLARVTNCFLIREPREMLASYLRKMPRPTFDDTGYPQLREIFRHVRKGQDEVPPVLDSRDVLENPRRMLGLLCDRLELEFRDEMLQWPAGPRESDGIWASHWYPEVLTSTKFLPYRPQQIDLPEGYDGLLQQCREVYEELYQARLR